MIFTWFVRRPFLVKGCQVTEANIDDIANWCEGVVIDSGPRIFIRVPVENPRSVRQTEAHIGQWVLRSKHRGTFKFKVYTNEWLNHDFVSVAGADEGDDEGDVPMSSPVPTQATVEKPKPTPRVFDRLRTLPTQNDVRPMSFRAV